MFKPKLAMHAISDYKSSFLELLPHPPNYCFLKFLIVLCSSSEIPCHHIIATERGTMHRCLSHSTTLFLALRLPQLPPLTTPFFRPPSVFLVYNPPSSPSSCAFFFPGTEKMRSCAVCPEINRPYSPLSRAAEAASSLYLAVQYEQGRVVEMGETQGC